MKDGEARPAVLFDLDGTLTDPFVGITNGIHYAMERMGCTAPAAEDLRWCIGPPLHVTFAALLETTDETLVWEAVAHYRERYARAGMYENVLIPGIPEALAGCTRRGFFLSLATSKVKTYAGGILDHFGLARSFDAVHGSELDGTNADKADLIRHIVATESLDPSLCVMVGDRLHDVAGAKANGIPAIGVLWGFGGREELQEAGATEIVASPADLCDAVDRVLLAHA